MARDASAAMRRQRIITAAVSLFASAPYASVHMDMVAREAAVAKPTLYRYFPAKEALFVAALEWSLEDLRSAIGAVSREPVPAEVKLRRVMAKVLDQVEHLAPAIRAIESQDAHWGKESRRILRQGFRNLREEIAGLIRNGQSDGAFAEADPEIVSLMILGGLRMAAHARTGPTHARTGQSGKVSETMAQILLDGLRPTGAAQFAPLSSSTSLGPVS
jgi:AcrR family transcriptional regulator